VKPGKVRHVFTSAGDPAALTCANVVSEALTNASKHARASRVQVSGTDWDGRLELIVSDDGRGGADA
jgi:signal transduction histidine kinase